MSELEIAVFSAKLAAKLWGKRNDYTQREMTQIIAAELRKVLAATQGEDTP